MAGVLSMAKKEITGIRKLGIGKLIVPRLGYLRAPPEFKQIYGSLNRCPEPTEVSMAKEKGGVLLIYKFPEAEMEALKNKGVGTK